jgi:hypothetical protein
MKLCCACTIAVLLVSAGVGHAANVNANKPDEQPLLPPVQLNGLLQGYSLELDTDSPNQPDTMIPPGLSTLKDQDDTITFPGLKLTKPLDLR